MKAKFISLSKSNQSIKLFVDIIDKSQKKNDYQSFKYNNKELFKYSFNIINSQLNFSILPSAINQKKFYQKTIGSFIFDQSTKYSAYEVNIDCTNKHLLDDVIFGFIQKDYIYSVYKSDSKITKYKTSFKLPKNYNQLLKSINYLKQLVSEPSNIIFPESFVSLAQKNCNKKNMNTKIFERR